MARNGGILARPNGLDSRCQLVIGCASLMQHLWLLVYLFLSCRRGTAITQGYGTGLMDSGDQAFLSFSPDGLTYSLAECADDEKLFVALSFLHTHSNAGRLIMGKLETGNGRTRRQCAAANHGYLFAVLKPPMISSFRRDYMNERRKSRAGESCIDLTYDRMTAGGACANCCHLLVSSFQGPVLSLGVIHAGNTQGAPFFNCILTRGCGQWCARRRSCCFYNRWRTDKEENHGSGVRGQELCERSSAPEDASERTMQLTKVSQDCSLASFQSWRKNTEMTCLLQARTKTE